jgi:RNA polymerase sigma-70 factor (ECF subfamily)
MDDKTVAELLERARNGDRRALGALLEGQRPRLERLLALRLDGRLRGRVEPADIIQEAFLEASLRLEAYLRDPTMPFYLWLRFITIQRLQTIYREHLRSQKRDARREVSLDESPFPEAGSEALATRLLGNVSTPSQRAMRAEVLLRLRQTLDTMDAEDREVIALRHFEQLGNADVARVLGIQESAASKRYVRAIARLKEMLARIPGMTEYPWR